MNNTKKTIQIGVLLSIALAVTLSGCSFGAAEPTATPTEGPDLTITAAAQTAEAEITETARIFALSATATSTQTHTPTITFTPTNTATFTLTPSLTPSETPTETPTHTPIPYTGPPENAIIAYFVIRGSGGPIGCGDNLIPVLTGQNKTGNIESDLIVALNFLFSSGEYVIGLYNATHASGLKATSVDYHPGKGTAVTQLTGVYVAPVTKCDAHRYREQVWATAYQFDEITDFSPFMGGALLGDRLYSVMLNGEDE